MTEARRGELWLLDLGEPIGSEQGWQRPALVISSDEWNRHAKVLTVVPITRTKNDLPTRIEIEPDSSNGLRDTSYARCEDLRSVSAARLVHQMGKVDLVVLNAIGRVLRLFLEI